MRSQTERVPQTLVIGPADGMEAVVGTAVSHSEHVAVLPAFPGLESFTLTAPDLIVVCQHWPDEYSPAEVAQLMEAFPLARLVCSYGPWCASDGRTRTIWPAAVRVPAEEAAARIRKEAEVISGRRSPLPLTAGLDEIFAFDHG